VLIIFCKIEEPKLINLPQLIIMKRSKLLILLCSIFFVTNSSAQKEPKFKFGSITAADFSTTTYEIDSSASAVVLADIGSTVFEGNNKSSFSLVFKNYRRAHILNKNGYDIANVEIPLYTNGDMEEELQNLKAVTYNLENGKVVETKLEVKTAVFKDKINKNLVIKKFTFPNIKAGSIIEFEYKVHSDYIFNLQPWDFQGQFPRLWSEYRVAMPAFYTYVTLAQGYQSFYIKDQKNTRTAFHLAETRGTGASDKASFDANVTDYRWVMKDVPPLKTESYTSTIRNHIARIEFQLQSIGEPFTYQNVMNSWPVVAKDLLEDEDFGAQLKKDNSWLKDEVAIALKGATSPMEKVKNIYAWVRDNFTCTNHSRRYLEQSLKNVLKSRKGNEAEINLLLIALLRRADIQADPVMLSTRSNGFIHAVYPLLGRFNYVICLTMIDGKQVYLDASESDMGFGKLNYECFNGNARVINKDATPITLYSESIKEIKNTTVFIINNEEGKSIGSMTKVSGYYESVGMRNKIKEKGKDEFLKDFKKGFSTNFDITTGRVDSVANIEEPIGVYVEFDVKSGDEDIIYMNPMLMDGIKENPFKSAQRFYPVEMPYAIDETYNMQMEIPKGYVLDELPKQSVVKFNEEGDAVFEYRISSYESNIMFRSRLLVKRTIFLPEEYENLREFFNLVVKKHNEQIVFKKKSNP